MVEYARLSKGLRRHIRREKAAIRRQFNDTPEAHEKIKLLIEKFFRQNPPDDGASKVEVKNETPAVLKEPVKQKTKNAKRPQSRPRKTVK